MLELIIKLSASALLILGCLFFIKQFFYSKKLSSAEEKVQSRVDKANKQSQDILTKAHRDGQDIINKSKNSLNEEIKTRRNQVEQIEKRLLDKEKYLDERDSHMAEKDRQLETEIDRYKHLRKKQDDMIQELSVKLEKAAGFSKEEAKQILLNNVERDVKEKAGLIIKDIEEKARKAGDRKAREILTNSIQRVVSDHIAAVTTSSLELPDDEMKGRIIGREGRNIRAFEAAIGVDVIIDESPGMVILSCFDPIRRQIATSALQKLISDGRIHPARIEEMIEKAKEELDEFMKEKGEAAAERLQLSFHPKIVELLGRLHFRTSYGQNILSHSLEAAEIAAGIAQQLKVNVSLAKRGTILHDIGKALDFEQEGSHTQLGRDVCEKYGESPEILNCIMAHHEEEPPETIEAVIVKVADAISSSRPGARRESLETYIKRLEKLESLANDYDGVQKAYAIQAGREVRVMVKPDTIDDGACHKLSFDIAKRIESELDYPGEVKVSVIRETRASSVAR